RRHTRWPRDWSSDVCSSDLRLTSTRRILELGPRSVLVKRGEYGAILFSPESVFAVPAYPLEEVFDPTGAGDAFAGGVMGYLAARSEERRVGKGWRCRWVRVG